MGTYKKEQNRVARSSASGEKRISKPLKGENFYRDAKKVKRVNMLKGGKPTRDPDGKIIKAAEFQSRLPSGTVARVQPNRGWFGNTRTIGQAQLEQFREAIKEKVNNPFEVLLHRQKLPLSLLTDSTKVSRMHLLETESFSDTFGGKTQRKRPKLQAGSIEELVQYAEKVADNYDPTADMNLQINKDIQLENETTREWYERAGQSRRIWSELYKVIDSSDVIIHVLDARDPMGTRCRAVEKFIRTEAPHKHLIMVLNKCDLVPTWVTVSNLYLVFLALLGPRLVRVSLCHSCDGALVKEYPLQSW